MGSVLENDEFTELEEMSLEDSSLKRRNKNRDIRKNIYLYFNDFCRNTKLYGFSYLGDPQRSIIEKLYWLLFICISFYFCGILLGNAWMKWSQPQIFIFSTTPKPIWEIPFPAVTICPEAKVRQRLYNFTHYYHKVIKSPEQNLTNEELQLFSDMSLLCDSHLMRSGNTTSDLNIIKNLINVSPPSNEVFFMCKWRTTNQTCDNLFTPLVTENGICFSSNMLNTKEIFNHITFRQYDDEKYSDGWTFEDGYIKNDGFPSKTPTAGTKGGLFLVLRSYEQDLDYICHGPVHGFRVLLHSPTEIPRLGNYYFRAPLNQETVVSVKPHLITTNPSLKNIAPSSRQCFFANERPLKFFRIYNQQNCLTECVTNITLKKCNCVAFHMPREESTKICGPGSNTCMFEAEHELLIREADMDISDTDYKKQEPVCNCLPACTTLNYDVEISQADFNWPKVLQAFKENTDIFPGIQLSRLTIFFKDLQFQVSERNIFYSRTEFLAICGGILALFTGFSAFSLAEIIYFLTIRLFFEIRKYSKSHWRGGSKLRKDQTILVDE